jgi:hypothetical protein
MTLNHILLLLILLAFPHGLPDHRFMLQFVFYCAFCRIMNPPFHPPSVCPSANLSPFHLPHTETRQWGPHPSSIFTTFMPPLGHSLTTGAPVSVFCTSFPHLFIILLYKHLLFPTFVFCRHRWRPAFLFWPYATHVTLGRSITSHLPSPESSVSSEYYPGLLPFIL